MFASAADLNGFLVALVVDVDLGVLRPRRDEGLVDAAEGGVERVEALRDARVLADQGAVVDVPQVQALKRGEEKKDQLRVQYIVKANSVRSAQRVKKETGKGFYSHLKDV